jgi:hypothetical protein
VLVEEPLGPGVAKARVGLRSAGTDAPVIHAGAGAFIDGEMLDALEEIEAFEDDDDDPERNDPTAPMGEAIAALNARDHFSGAHGAEGHDAVGYGAVGYGAVGYDAVGYDTAGRALAGRDAAHDVNFGAPRLRAAAKLPIANLEMPTGERLDLTPSPVPRVALAPATGSVDISLVPGPHASRNLPTLAAHHLLGAGRRQQQRRPAAAVTVPPPGRTNSHLDVPVPRRSALARDVRSSKREIVLGLAIGLGLSMLLAGLGQAYLKSGVQDVIAAVPPAPPAQLESLTLAARPQTAPAAAVAVPPAAVPPPAPLPGAVPHVPTAEKRVADALLASNTESSHSSASGGRSAVAARAVPARASGSKRSVEPRAPRRASNARVLAAASARRNDGAPAEPPAFEAGKSFEESPPPPRSPLSPAESAGLGLDLPL